MFSGGSTLMDVDEAQEAAEGGAGGHGADGTKDGAKDEGDAEDNVTEQVGHVPRNLA